MRQVFIALIALSELLKWVEGLHVVGSVTLFRESTGYGTGRVVPSPQLPKPILIHYKAGSDRTGMAAALYLASHGYSEAKAERQISFRYGHVSLPVSAAWPMDLSWGALEPGPAYAR